MFLDNDETLASVKMKSELPPRIRDAGWETCRETYRCRPVSGRATSKPSSYGNGVDSSADQRVLFVKLRDGVLPGLIRLAEKFDIVISSTGEQSYIEHMIKVFDPTG